ncbi:ABC transporter ATP-binding protein [Chloroflexota bacterium]
MEELLLKVENLCTSFLTSKGILSAVNGVSFQLKRGETLGLVGESGCGKSITCLSILRLLPPNGYITNGEILFDGENLLEKSEAEMRRIRGRKISMILQDPMTSLNPVFSIGNQVTEAIRLHTDYRGKSLREKAIEALRLVRLPAAEQRIGDYPHQMSGGMKQRVAGAVAISCGPSLLIGDEPTTSLDATVQAQYLEVLMQILEETKAAMIFVTHNFGIVANVCDKVAVMYAGRIVEMAEVTELFDHPCHPYTVGLMGCLISVHRREQLVSIPGQLPSPINVQQGCPFAPRCTRVIERCHSEFPPETCVGGDHYVSCWQY